jgi:hypothetical protein
MDEHRVVGLEHQEPEGVGQDGVEAAGVDGGAAGNDETHGRSKVRVEVDENLRLREALQRAKTPPLLRLDDCGGVGGGSSSHGRRPGRKWAFAVAVGYVRVSRIGDREERLRSPEFQEPEVALHARLNLRLSR